MRCYDDKLPVEVADGIYHLGVADIPNVWANIPYLIVSGDEGVVIDPGSARPDFFEVVLRKLSAVIDPRKVRHLIVQHQDPDLCAALPLLGPLVASDHQVLTPLEAKLLVQHYHISAPLIGVEDDDTLVFGDGRTLVFAMTPYCHFVGSMVTYDLQTKTLFSSDAFGAFSDGGVLYADADYADRMSPFLGEYLGSRRALEYAVKRVEQVAAAHGLERICPQHGSVVEGELLSSMVDALRRLEVGGLIDDLAAKHGIVLEACC